MPAHLSPDHPMERTPPEHLPRAHGPLERSPLERALLAWVVAVTVVGAAWLGSVFAASPETKAFVAWAGGGAALVLCAAVAVAAYHAALARPLRARLAEAEGSAARLERQIGELADGPLPQAIRLVRQGALPEEALASLPRPSSPSLQRVLNGVVHEVASAERAAAEAQADLAVLEEQAAFFADTTLPAVGAKLRGMRRSPDAVLTETEPPSHPLVRRLLETTVHTIAEGERSGAFTRIACAHAASRVQAAVTRMLAQLRELQFRFGEEPFFADLLDLDHGVSQIGRTADGIAVLSGGRTGRRWTKPIRMESILRGAMGRIADYRRLRLHYSSTAHVAGFAAEGVMHALAELMDNATMFSSRDTEVHVYVEEEDAGVVVLIEDSGHGMRHRERARAERLVTAPLEVANLPGTRLGLAVVGRLAVRYGLRVSFRPSSRGGLGVVVLIPRRLVVPPKDPFDADVPSALDGYAHRAGPITGNTGFSSAPVHDAPHATAASGTARIEAGALDLPKRPRGESLVGVAGIDGAAPEPAAAESARSDAGRFAAFRGAGRSPGEDLGGAPDGASATGDGTEAQDTGRDR
ncbi:MULTISPECIES: ATP-binding protein [Actinomadura]|uniref:histidine kinase n=2 Tax=Actinomadura yumaensis TaxID=111807 RepID=A0ABW2CPP8_9ACTN|nr:ATP-binding protein [Actinomadura sp. J1-007]